MTEKNIEKQKQFFIEKIAKFCDKCGASYHLDDVQVIQEKNSSTIIHFSCQNCKSNNIANLVSPMGFSTRIPINCDLSVKEFPKFASQDPISLDDVLEVHLCFEDSKGCIRI